MFASSMKTGFAILALIAISCNRAAAQDRDGYVQVEGEVNRPPDLLKTFQSVHDRRVKD